MHSINQNLLLGIDDREQNKATQTIKKYEKDFYILKSKKIIFGCDQIVYTHHRDPKEKENNYMCILSIICIGRG